MLSRVKRWWRSKRVIYLVLPPVPHVPTIPVADGRASRHLALLLAGRWCPSIVSCDRYQQEMVEMCRKRKNLLNEYQVAVQRLERDVEFLEEHLFPGDQK